MALILRVSCTSDVGCDVQATTLIRGPQLLTPSSTLFLIYLNPTNYAITMRGKGDEEFVRGGLRVGLARVVLGRHPSLNPN
jgi:hypothetical protein